MTVLIVIPALNEELSLPDVLAEAHARLPECDVLVVDDGSVDGTADVARRAHVGLLRLPFNLGVGGALRAGFRYAVDHNYDAVVQLDADGQHEAADIRKLLDALADGADLAIGSRFSESSSPYAMGRVRRGAAGLLRMFVRLASGRQFTDTSSGFRGFSRPMFQFFAATYPVDYLGDTVEALLLACYNRFKVVEVPVSMRARQDGLPSTRRLKLVYHYIRVLLVIVTTAAPRRSRALAVGQ